ncbi:hypothetical protein B0H14DRAFT_2574512 [Mycena olivaceomarginata]|nr:hypothetical protein B0H14DRAFT_2574512 [Mycena olivaceomarginata]
MKHTGYSLPVAPTQPSAAPSQDVAAVYSPRQQGLAPTSAGIISSVTMNDMKISSRRSGFFFPANATPLPAAPPAAPATPSTSSATPPAPQAKTCAFGPCQLIKLHRLCPNQLCKRHCLEAGACAVHASPAPPPLPRKALPPLSDNLHAPAVTAIQNPPSWPRWIFESKGPYQAYSTPYSSWMTVEASYIHTLSTGQPLLVRSLGVGAGVDEEEHIARAHAHANPPVPRFLVQPLLPKSKGKRRARQITRSPIRMTRSLSSRTLPPPHAGVVDIRVVMM